MKRGWSLSYSLWSPDMGVGSGVENKTNWPLKSNPIEKCIYFFVNRELSINMELIPPKAVLKPPSSMCGWGWCAVSSFLIFFVWKIVTDPSSYLLFLALLQKMSLQKKWEEFKILAFMENELRWVIVTVGVRVSTETELSWGDRSCEASLLLTVEGTVFLS